MRRLVQSEAGGVTVVCDISQKSPAAAHQQYSSRQLCVVAKCLVLMLFTSQCSRAPAPLRRLLSRKWNFWHCSNKGSQLTLSVRYSRRLPRGLGIFRLLLTKRVLAYIIQCNNTLISLDKVSTHQLLNFIANSRVNHSFV